MTTGRIVALVFLSALLAWETFMLLGGLLLGIKGDQPLSRLERLAILILRGPFVLLFAALVLLEVVGHSGLVALWIALGLFAASLPVRRWLAKRLRAAG